MVKKFIRKLKYHFQEVLKIKKSPSSIAGGFAIGTFLAILPTFGFGILIGFFILLIFKRVSKISMLIAFVVWNPLILISLYGISYYIGDLIFGELQLVEYELTFLEQIYRYSRRLLVGSVVVSIVVSFVSYWVIYWVSREYQKRNFINSRLFGVI
jgi:uncharacterized protein